MNNKSLFKEILATAFFFIKLFIVAIVLPIFAIIPTTIIHIFFQLSLMGIVFWLLAFYMPMFIGSHWAYNKVKNWLYYIPH